MNPTLQDDPRLSAWLMDEMSVDERTEFEQIIDAAPDGRSIADELQSVAASVEAALATEPEYRLTEIQREVLFNPPAQKVAAPAPVEIDHGNEENSNILPWKRLRYTGDVTEKIRMSDRMETRRKSANFPTYAISAVAAIILGMLVVGSILFLRQDDNKGLVKTAEEEKEVAISISSGAPAKVSSSQAVVGSSATGYLFRDPANEEFRRSSFALKPGSASYQVVSTTIRDGVVPNPAVVQIEEMLNYFIYDYPEPEEEQSMSVSVESAPCPWEPEHQLVQIGLKGRDAGVGENAKQSVATDIDVQVEFDPATVKEYRLIGYDVAEGSAVKSAGENDPTRDFAAGDATTALYEVVPVESAHAAKDDDSLLTVHLNYNEPNDDDLKKSSSRMLASRLAFSEHKRWSDTTSDFRFAATVAGFGMKLRGQEDDDTSLDFAKLESMAENSLDGKDTLRRMRFVELIEKMQKLSEKK